MRPAAQRANSLLVMAVLVVGACGVPERTPTPTLSPIATPSPTAVPSSSPTPSPSATDPPEDAWVVTTSKTFPYRMAHPPGWTVEPSRTGDAYAIDGQPYVHVAAQPVDEGTTLETFSSSLRAFYKDDFGEPESAVDASLGGQPARRLVYEFVNDQGQDVTFVDDIAVHGGLGWEVFLLTAGGASDIPVFEQFVATFEFTD